MIAAALLCALSVAQGGVAADSVPMEYTVGGVKVIHLRRPPSSDVVAVQLYLLGGSRQITAENAGIEPLILSASAYGTEKYPGERTRRALAHTGSYMMVSASSDWTAFTFDGLKQVFDSTWSVFAERLMHPTLEQPFVDLVRSRMLSAVARRQESPEEQADRIADSLSIRGHPYAAEPTGSRQSLTALTVPMLRAYAKETFVTSRMLLVVVGDIPRDQVERNVSQTLGTLPKGTYQWSLPETWKAAKAEVVVVDRSVPTNYIVGYMSGPARSSPEYFAYERAMSLLGGLVSYEVRERAGLSYAAGVSVRERGAPSAVLHMSTTNPDSAIKLVNRVLSIFDSDATIPRYALRESAKAYASAYLRETETASGRADVLGRGYLYEGDANAGARRAQIMARVTFPDMRRAIRTYAKNIQFGFVGDSTMLPRKEMTKR